jgi:ABC-type nickel/cobalt efflux system permease component RcnA
MVDSGRAGLVPAGGLGNSDRLPSVLATRQVATGVFITDVVLFVLASAFNDRSSTSVDGILWWVAIAVFLLLIVFGLGVLVQFLRTRRRRPRRSRVR